MFQSVFVCVLIFCVSVCMYMHVHLCVCVCLSGGCRQKFYDSLSHRGLLLWGVVTLSGGHAVNKGQITRVKSRRMCVISKVAVLGLKGWLVRMHDSRQRV